MAIYAPDDRLPSSATLHAHDSSSGCKAKSLLGGLPATRCISPKVGRGPIACRNLSTTQGSVLLSSPWLCRSYLEERLPHCVQFASRTSVAPASGSLTHFLSLNSTRVDHRNQNPRQLDSRNTLNLSEPLTCLKDFCKDPMTLMPSIRSQTGFSFPSAPTSSVPSRSTKKNCHQSPAH